MKLKRLASKIQSLESRLSPNLDWATIVDKFKELEAKIERIESLERDHGFLSQEIKTLVARLNAAERALDNFKKRSPRRK